MLESDRERVEPKFIVTLCILTCVDCTLSRASCALTESMRLYPLTPVYRRIINYLLTFF